MVAKVDFPYWGKALKAGEEFDAEEQDVRVLEVAGRAKPLGETPVKRKKYRTRVMTAER